MRYRGYARTVDKIEHGAGSNAGFVTISKILYYYLNEKDPVIYANLESEEWVFPVEFWEKLVDYFNGLSQKEKQEMSKGLKISLEGLNNVIGDFNDWLEDGKKAETGWITIDWF